MRGCIWRDKSTARQGYEEAACQGLMAGINAALLVQGEAPFTLDRTEAYTGILIDDLICKGTNEPYRMFTSRAEFRLHLRIDNADRRLTPYGYRLGLISQSSFRNYQAKQARAVAMQKLLVTQKVDMASLKVILPELDLGNVGGQTYAQLLKRPEVSLEQLLPVLREAMTEAGVVWVNARTELKSVETEIKFAGYLDQQRKAIEKLKKAEQRAIPVEFEYAGMSGLSREMQETLTRVRPQTLGQASRIPGVTPAAVSLLHVHLEVADRRAGSGGGPDRAGNVSTADMLRKMEPAGDPQIVV